VSVRMGLDLGGTKTEIVLISESGEILFRERRPTPSADYRLLLEHLSSFIADVEKRMQIRATSIGVGMPGAISPATGLVKNANTTCLIGKPFSQDLEVLLRRKVSFANDANCFALSEALHGAGRGSSVVFGVILGTGVGAGIVVHGRVLNGPNSIAGEWGHNPLPWPQPSELPGPACYCGQRGCIETFLSGPGLACDHESATGQKLSASDIEQRARDGDAHCEATLLRYEDRLARGLASVINVLDPDTIVLGGGVSNLKRLYTNIPKQWQRYIFSDRVDTKLKPAELGDSSGVVGAAELVP
jgi:fructokinase